MNISGYKKIWDEKPLLLILWSALIFRLLASVFARGWGMFDDHFIVIESAGSWAAGHDYNSWLPGSPGNQGPTGHNFFYPGLHYLLFSFMNQLGLSDPQSKMFAARLIHAGLSMVTVWCGYQIAWKLGGKEPARLAGILLALFWFMPWMSVRNLVEMASVPFVMLGFWLILREASSRQQMQNWLLAGLMMGIAFNIRPQTIFLPVGIGLVLLFRKEWINLAIFVAGSAGLVLLVQGVIDIFIWGKPFVELQAYLFVNIADRNSYINLPWYNYFLTLGGLLIPPVSLFLLFGFARMRRKHLMIFIPVLLYFIFHSLFPNKQERFIIPIVPLLIVSGTVGWLEFTAISNFRNARQKLLKASWIFFWVINTTLLLVFTFTYSKKARVEAMRHLSAYSDISAIAVVDEDGSPELVPKFYLNQWPVCYSEQEGDQSPSAILDRACANKDSKPVQFILFTGTRNISRMVTEARQCFPRLVHETTIETGFVDWFVHWLNPINKNRKIYIYRNAEVIPEKKRNIN